MFDFVRMCMSGHSAPTRLSGHKPLDVPWVLLPNVGDPTVTSSMAGDWLSCVPHAGPGRILPAVTKRTIGHWDILAPRL